MKRLLLLGIIFLGFHGLYAQETVSLATEEMVFYSLTEGEKARIALSDWDIAIEPQNDYAIRINEIQGARVWVNTEDLRENCNGLQSACRGLQDYTPQPYDTTGMRSGQNGWVEVHNGYQSWSEGAFNQEQPFLSSDLQSFGWGGYKGFSSDPFHAILGYHIFVVQTQQGNYKQFFVRKSLSSGFEFAYANLDGTETQEHTLARDDYANKLFAYVSLNQRQVRNVEPNLDSWDMVFTQYPEQKANGDYTVRYGMLSNPNVSVEAQTANNADCLSPQGTYSDNINTIGQSWAVNNGSSQTANPDARYFVQRASGDVFQFGVLAFDAQSETFTLANAPVVPNSITIDGLVSEVSCVTCADGAIDITAGGGSCPYQYSWSHGPQTADLSNLAPGSYTITITDNSGNTANKTFVIENFPCNMALGAVNKVQPSCFGDANGSIQVALENATEPVQYSWSNGSTGNPLENIAAGSYTLTATDANGCELVSDITLEQPDPITVSASVSDEDCFGCENGEILLEVVGGNGGYTYLWNDGDTDGSRGGLAPGDYSVSITDAKGCSFDTSFTVGAYTCSEFVFRPTTQQPSCANASDGTIGIAEISGGTAPYTYLWESGENTAQLSGKPEGQYRLTITDSKNCTQQVTLTLEAPEPLFVSVAKEDESCAQCADGAIAVDSVSGGTAPYSYSWNTGATTAAIDSLAPGSYTLAVTDANGCSTSITRRIQEFGCTLSILNVDTEEPSCFGFNDGELSLDISGGNGELEFDWSNGSDLQFASRLEAGEYSVVVTDETGCIDSVSVVLNQPDSLQLEFQYQGPSCGTCSDAQLTAIPAGGTAPYIYAWNTSEQTQRINVESGEYSIELTDNNGCVVFRDTTLEVVSSVVDVQIASVQWYPNPVVTALIVQADPGQVQHIALSTMSGKVVATQEVTQERTHINMERLPSGAYVLRVSNAAGGSASYTVLKR